MVERYSGCGEFWHIGAVRARETGAASNDTQQEGCEQPGCNFLGRQKGTSSRATVSDGLPLHRPKTDTHISQ